MIDSKPKPGSSIPPRYRDAAACKTCCHVGDSLLNGAFRCNRHQRTVMGSGICDDHTGRVSTTRRTLTEAQYQYIVSRPWVDEAVFAKIQNKIRTGEWTVTRDHTPLRIDAPLHAPENIM